MWRVVSLFALTAAVCLPNFLAAQDPMRLAEEAVRAQQAGDYTLAIQRYRDFLELVPAHPDILANLGAAYAGAGDTANAISAYLQALQLDPQHQAARLNLGIAYYRTAQGDRAIPEFQEVLSRDPSNLQAAFLLADCYFRAGEYEQVIKVLRPFDNREKEDKGIDYLLGTSLIRLGQVQEGERYVDRILGGGDTAVAHLMIASVRREASDVAGALEEVRHAIDLEPALPGSYSLLGQLLLAVDGRDQVKRNPSLLREVRLEGVTDEVEQAFEKELELNPNDFEAHFYLGYILREHERYAEARIHFEKALLIRPNAFHVAYHLGKTELLQGDPAEARRILLEVVSEAPDFAEAHVALASACYRLNLTEEGNRHRDIVVRLNSATEP
jgi:tetratricopeptide (TPR) repeat protein